MVTNATNVAENATNVAEKVATCQNELKNNEDKIYQCHCGKLYKYRQSLSLHKKKCNQLMNIASDTNTINNELITKMILEKIIDDIHLTGDKLYKLEKP